MPKRRGELPAATVTITINRPGETISHRLEASSWPALRLQLMALLDEIEREQVAPETGDGD